MSIIRTDVLFKEEEASGDRAIGFMSRVLGNCLGVRGSIPGRVIPKTQKMVRDAALFNTQHYKIHFGVVAIENGALGSPSTKVAKFTYINNLFCTQMYQ